LLAAQFFGLLAGLGVSAHGVSPKQDERIMVTP